MNLNNPEILEELYNSDRKLFKKTFKDNYSEFEDFQIAHFWKVRLDYDNKKRHLLNKESHPLKIQILITICLLVGTLIKLPELFNINTSHFLYYEKNVALLILFGMSLFYLLRKSKINKRKILFTTLVFAGTGLYLNILPSDRNSDSINLAYLHLPLMLWSFYGIIFLDFNWKDKSKRINFVKYNGDIMILSSIIILAGMILTGVSLGLFSAVGFDIEEFYISYIVVLGAVSTPIVASYILDEHPQITNKIAPIIANIFSPLVLITLITFLISFVFAGKNPYRDRDFLLVFNLMLIGVMGVIVFAISETTTKKKNKGIILLLIAALSLIVDIIALSAIVYRLGEFGLTPNRIAVLGSNLLIFGHLILIVIDLYKVTFKGAKLKDVENTIVKYIPIYASWTFIIGLLLPLIFKMK